MANVVLIIGESGTGKSSSLRNLPSEETYIINILDKPLPFKGWKKKYIQKEGGNYFATDYSPNIIRAIENINKNRPDIGYIIIDDFQYSMANEFMRRALEKGYGKFAEIGKIGFDIIQALLHCRTDLDCFVLSHSHIGDDGIHKCKTIGKMLDDKITLEGLFTVVFHSLIVDGHYKFLTKNDGVHVAKSPMGMFEEKLIDNDLKEISKIIAEYYNEDVPQ